LNKIRFFASVMSNYVIFGKSEFPAEFFSSAFSLQTIFTRT
jgi:hypothetical protein